MNLCGSLGCEPRVRSRGIRWLSGLSSVPERQEVEFLELSGHMSVSKSCIEATTWSPLIYEWLEHNYLAALYKWGTRIHAPLPVRQDIS